jgi:hypothetical protein
VAEPGLRATLLVTQVNDGSPAGSEGRGRVATSSAPRPDIVALMLEAGRRFEMIIDFVYPRKRELEVLVGYVASRSGAAK